MSCARRLATTRWLQRAIRIYKHVESTRARALADGMGAAIWLQGGVDVTINVTTPRAVNEKATSEEAASLVDLVRPVGLEPATFRSAI